MFHPIDYLEWIDGRPEAATHDLGSSDLRPAVPDAGRPDDPTSHDRVAPDALVGLPDPDDDRPVEAEVADGYDTAPEAVVLSAGTSHANVLVAATTLSDPTKRTEPPRLLAETPGYEPHTATAASLGADVWRFRRDEGELDPGRIEAAIDETVDLVVCTNRHNPSGRLADRETLTEVAGICAQAGAVFLVDEVYAGYRSAVAEGRTGPFGGPTAVGLPNTVVTNSVTKFLGLGALRLGWAIADAGFAERLRRTAWHLPVVAEPSRALGRRAFASLPTLADRSRTLAEANHDLLESFVADRADLTGPVCPGSPYALVTADGADGDAVSEAAWEHDLLVVPGRFYGAPERFRVSLGRPPEQMTAALEVLGETLDTL